jgi:hypothetical protein
MKWLLGCLLFMVRWLLWCMILLVHRFIDWMMLWKTKNKTTFLLIIPHNSFSLVVTLSPHAGSSEIMVKTTTQNPGQWKNAVEKSSCVLSRTTTIALWYFLLIASCWVLGGSGFVYYLLSMQSLHHHLTKCPRVEEKTSLQLSRVS